MSPQRTQLDPHLARRLAEKKARLDALRPLPTETLTRLQADLRLQSTYHSNAIEGNSLTLRETQVVIEDGLTVGGKTLREHLEAVNHAAAFDALIPLADTAVPLTTTTICDLHGTVMAHILASAGRWRSIPVTIRGAAVVPPAARQVPDLMRQWVDWIGPDGAGQQYDPVTRAAIAHHGFEAVHPFEDGNGRVGRLLLNLILLRAGYPPAFLRRDWRLAYLTALDAASAENYVPIINLVGRAVEESLDVYLAACTDIVPAHALPLRDLADMTGMNAAYLAALARSGRLAAVKHGHRWYSTAEAVERYQDEVRDRDR